MTWIKAQAHRQRDSARGLARRSATRAIIESQSVKTTAARSPPGHDAGKKINGRKYHALGATEERGGFVLEPRPASIPDRDRGGPLSGGSRGTSPFSRKVFADSGCAGENDAKAARVAVEILGKNPDQVPLAVQSRRPVVEHFLAWIGRVRLLTKGFEATIDSARAFLCAASVILPVRRPVRTP